MKEQPSPKTLEAIQEKQAKAQELRELEKSKRIGRIADERLSRARDRKENIVKEKTTKIRTGLDAKMEVAIEKRNQLLHVVVEKAKKETEKLDKANQ